MRAWRPPYGSLSAEERRRANCRSHTYSLVQRGHLKKGPCQRCGSTRNVEAHHADYSKPREVEWVCRPCHREEHLKPTRLDAIAAKHLAQRT